MAEREMVYIPWTVTNWITVVLMAALGYMLLGLLAQGYQNWKQKNA
jgi:hypothetical protein